jgi:hypothetical protein
MNKPPNTTAQIYVSKHDQPPSQLGIKRGPNAKILTPPPPTLCMNSNKYTRLTLKHSGMLSMVRREVHLYKITNKYTGLFRLN